MPDEAGWQWDRSYLARHTGSLTLRADVVVLR
jgi:hypothetical protein